MKTSGGGRGVQTLLLHPNGRGRGEQTLLHPSVSRSLTSTLFSTLSPFTSNFTFFFTEILIFLPITSFMLSGRKERFHYFPSLARKRGTSAEQALAGVRLALFIAGPLLSFCQINRSESCQPSRGFCLSLGTKGKSSERQVLLTAEPCLQFWIVKS